MKISQVFPSKYLVAADLSGKTFTLRIKSVTLDDMVTHDNKRTKKPVVWFVEAKKGLVINVTNAKIIATIYGDETDDWTNKRIAIYPTRVKAFGEMQDCIRVREEVPAVSKPVAQAPSVEEASGLDDAEDFTDYDPNAFEPDSDPA